MAKNCDPLENWNPNHPQIRYTKENQCLNNLINLIQELRNTRKPSYLSLSTSLDMIVASIGYACGQLYDIYDYRDGMREF